MRPLRRFIGGISLVGASHAFAVRVQRSLCLQTIRQSMGTRRRVGQNPCFFASEVVRSPIITGGLGSKAQQAGGEARVGRLRRLRLGPGDEGRGDSGETAGAESQDGGRDLVERKGGRQRGGRSAQRLIRGPLFLLFLVPFSLRRGQAKMRNFPSPLQLIALKVAVTVVVSGGVMLLSV